MPKKVHKVELSAEEIEKLEKVISNGKSSAKLIRRCNILLGTNDTRLPKLPIREVADRYQVSPNTVNKIRSSYAEKGLEGTIGRKKRATPPVPPKITGEIEAKIIALCCTTPPEGYSRWTIRMLANKTIEIGYIDSISRTSVNTILKKTNYSRT
jgi:transposase